MAPPAPAPSPIEYPWHKPCRDIREAVGQLCGDFSLDYWDRHERDAVFPEEFFRAFAAGGWLGAHIPPEYGGSGLSLTEAAAILEEVAASGGALDACSAVHIPQLCVPVLLRHASEEQRRELVPKVASGELYVTFGVTEPNAGTDTTSIETFATRTDAGWRISGQKIWNSGALRGDKVLLIARTERRDPERRAEGMTLFLVDLDAPGVAIQAIPKISRNAVASTELFLQDVEVGEDAVVGEVGRGFYHLLAGLNGERLLLAAEALGMSRWVLGQATRYARERVVFGRPIGQNQAIQHPLAEAYVRLLAASQVVGTALTAFDEDAPREQVGALTNSAKWLASEAFFFTADQAFQTFGGYSFSREYHIGRHWIQARLQRVAPVSNQLVLNFIAEQVLDLPRSY